MDLEQLLVENPYSMPLVVSDFQAFSMLGVEQKLGIQSLKDNTFPTPYFYIGSKPIIPTAPLLVHLGVDQDKFIDARALRYKYGESMTVHDISEIIDVSTHMCYKSIKNGTFPFTPSHFSQTHIFDTNSVARILGLRNWETIIKLS